MANNRIFWAVTAVGIAPHQSLTFVPTKGVQSVGITTTFNLEQVFELGQLAIYENIENVPDIEVTIEKVLDGTTLLYHLCTSGHTANTLVGRSNQRCTVAMSIYGDTNESASGTPIGEVFMSGLYLSSITYTLPVEGNCTEAVTLVGNNKVSRTSGFVFQPTYTNTDTAVLASGGVQRRENVLWAVDSIVTPTTGSLMPSGISGIPGISSSGTNDKALDVYGAHIQNITVRADLGRDAIYELGRKGPYFRYVRFPVQVTTDIEIISTLGDGITAKEEGVDLVNVTNLVDQRIVVCLTDSTKLDMGRRNKLSNVTIGGGDTGGGNQTVTYSYVGWNDLTISHNQENS